MGNNMRNAQRVVWCLRPMLIGLMVNADVLKIHRMILMF